jgi:predicted MFS family arabinose efflux permease
MRRRTVNPAASGLAIAGLALLLALCGLSWLATTTSTQLLFPELAHKALAETEQVQRKIDTALTLGIPIEQLIGIDAVYAGLKKGDADIAFLAVTDSADHIIFVQGLSATAFRQMSAAAEKIPAPEGLSDGQSLKDGYLVTALPLQTGRLFLGHDEQALNRPLVNNFYDIAVVVLVVMLLAAEIMLPVITANITSPAGAAIRVLKSLAKGRLGAVTGQNTGGTLGTFIVHLDAFAGSVAGSRSMSLRSTDTVLVVSVRLLAFLFVFAEELGRSFLPVYIAEHAALSPGLNINLATGVLTGLHMSCVAVAMPFATILYSRLGRVRLYGAGALLATAGLVGTALAAGYWDLVVWRALSAIGYAATFVACQGFVIETTQRDNRASGMAMMVGGITLADICGPAFGGVMAERFGQNVTFLIGAGMTLVACLLVVRLMAGGARVAEPPQRVTLRGFAATFRNRRLLIQVCLAALPAKLLLTGFLYYLLPVTLLGYGWSAAEVGRVVMIYGLAMLVGGPLFAHVTDRGNNQATIVALGGVLSSVLLLFVPFAPAEATFWIAVSTVAALGIGQSMSIPAQVSLIVDLATEKEVNQGQAPELTVLRFIERFGGGMGPMIAAPLAAKFGTTEAIGLLGLYCLASALLYVLMVLLPSRRRKATAEEEA